MSRRGVMAAAILVSWVAGLGMLVRREYFRPHIDRLAEAALRVTPDAVFYAVMHGDRQIGFASSTLDTATTEIEQRDYFVADVPAGGTVRRAEVRTNVILTRTLRMKSFDMEFDAEQTPVKVTGQVHGDSVLELVVARGAALPDTQHVPLSGPILLPTLVPLAVALESRPKIGRSVTLPVFDQGTLRPRHVRMDVRAESLFVVNDSSVYDSASGRWSGVLPDTVRGWQIVSQAGGGVDGWVDEQGRLIVSNQLGFQLQRRPYEVAFENWRLSDTLRRAPAQAAIPAASSNVVNATLVAASRRPGAPLQELRVRVRGTRSGLALNGGRQRLLGDTLLVAREDVPSLAARYTTIRNASERVRYPELKGEPFLEVDHHAIREMAERIAAGSRDPRLVAQRILRWVHDSVAKDVSAGIPSALHVLLTRRGDANEHTQLFVALARAAGIPSRIATGVVLVDGKFYHHAWPEVMLRGWVAVDPVLGQFPAGAGHVRLLLGPIGREGDLTRLLADLRLDVLTRR
jgi:hypothetical protein